MLQFLLTRILTAIPTLLLVTVLVFLLTRMVPGDPALLMLGDMATESSLADLRHSMGLDRGSCSSSSFGPQTCCTATLATPFRAVRRCCL